MFDGRQKTVNKRKKNRNFPAELRLTAQREVVWEIIQETGHLDAEELYLKAKKKNPRISLSTVYRSLIAFKKAGYLQDLNYDRSHRHFELKQADHLHFICSNCKKVSELNTGTLTALKKEAEEALKVKIEKTDLTLVGLCEKCLQKQKK